MSFLSTAMADVPPAGWNPFPEPGNLNLVQILFLMCMYAYVLYEASEMIALGSGLLLLVPQLAPIVGSVVIPVLGAVPDGAMVLFSGLGPDAQNQVSVGVGALAGSTIMLLTLPWFVAVFTGRVNYKNGVATYKRPAGENPKTWDKRMPPGNMSLTGTGVQWNPEFKTTLRMMILSLVSYFIIQCFAFSDDFMPKPAGLTTEGLVHDQHIEAKGERMPALVGFVICILGFLYYLNEQWASTRNAEGAIDDVIAEANVQAMKAGTLTLRGAMAKFRERNWATLCQNGDLEQVLMNKESMDEVRRMCKVLAPFFAQYDLNGDNQIDFEEFRMIFKDVNENLSREAQILMFDAADTDQSGYISFEEFVACFMSFALDPCNDLKDSGDKRRTKANPKKYLEGEPEANEAEEEEDEEAEEEEDMPEDLADLEPEEQQKRIKMRSLYHMGIGTVLILIFSDPMVDLLSELGNRLGISPFYVSFVLAPMASNSSEIVAAYQLASKRTAKSMTYALNCLIGSTIMNNTFCLGIFLGLVYFKRLAWEFSAETISIVFVQLLIFGFAYFRNGMTLGHAFFIVALYPFPLILVWVLENIVGWD